MSRFWGSLSPGCVCRWWVSQRAVCQRPGPAGLGAVSFLQRVPRAAAPVWELLQAALFSAAARLPAVSTFWSSPSAPSAVSWGSLAVLLCLWAVSFCVFETYYCWFTWIIGFVLQEIGSNYFFFTFTCAVGDLLSTPGCLKVWFVEPSPE